MLSQELREATEPSAFSRIIKALRGLHLGPAGRATRPRMKSSAAMGTKGVVANIKHYDNRDEGEVRKRAHAMLEKLGLNRDFNITTDEWPEGMMIWFTPK